MTKIKTVTIFLMTAVLFFNLTAASLAQTSSQLELPEQKLNPGSMYYPLKRLWEKFFTYLKFSDEAKADYFDHLVKVRLSELKYVVENKALGELEKSTQRFSFHAGQLTQQAKKISEPEQANKVSEEFTNYVLFLNDLRDQYPANSSFWLLIQHSINSLVSYSEELRK